MLYKTVFVPLAGKTPTKFADALSRQLSELDDQGFEAIAIFPLTHDNGSTLGVLVTARKPRQ
jgi:hypothetical protein